MSKFHKASGNIFFERDGVRYRAALTIEWLQESREGSDIDGNRGHSAWFMEELDVEELWNLTDDCDVDVTQEWYDRIYDMEDKWGAIV